MVVALARIVRSEFLRIPLLRRSEFLRIPLQDPLDRGAIHDYRGNHRGNSASTISITRWRNARYCAINCLASGVRELR